MKGTSPDKEVMKIVRIMFLFAVRRNVNILLKHVPGKHNLAHSLLRLQVRQFKEWLPSAEEMPTVVDQEVWNVGWDLDVEKERYLAESLSGNTRRTYATGGKTVQTVPC